METLHRLSFLKITLGRTAGSARSPEGSVSLLGSAGGPGPRPVDRATPALSPAGRWAPGPRRPRPSGEGLSETSGLRPLPWPRASRAERRWVVPRLWPQGLWIKCGWPRSSKGVSTGPPHSDLRGPTSATSSPGVGGERRCPSLWMDLMMSAGS